MKLTKITIENFKGIKEETSIDFSDFNVIVGQNDVGKSTILKALDIFLNGTTPTKDDLNNKADSEEIIISLEFNTNNLPVIIDENIETTFEEEELVNPENKLVIKKTWDTSKSKISPEAFLYRKKYHENDLISLSETQLISTCKKLGVNTQKANGSEFNNKEKRLKIREYNLQKNIEFEYEFEKLPTSGSNRFKIIHDKLKKAILFLKKAKKFKLLFDIY